MKTPTGSTILFLALAACAWACTTGSGATLTVQIAPNTNLCDYTTYAFLDSQFPTDEDGNPPSNLVNNDQVIKNTMSSYFAYLGITADSEDPDMTVGILYSTTDTSTPIQTCEKTPAGEWYGYPEGECNWETELVTVTKGSVMIDMIDESSGGLIFRAIFDGLVAGSVDVDDVNNGLREMFSYWPQDCAN